MKRAWEKPTLDILEVKMTMKGWDHGGGSFDPGHKHNKDCKDDFDS